MSLKSLIFLILSAFCWGPSYLFIKIAVPEIPPVSLVLLRVIIGAVLVYFLCLYQKHSLFASLRYWKQFLVIGFTLNTLPFCLISYGELYINSSLAGILNGMTLIFTAILAHFFIPHEPLTKQKILGIVVGLVGLTVIYLPLVLSAAAGKTVGALLIVLASLSYGIGTVYARTHIRKVPSTVLLNWQLIFSILILLPFSLAIDHPLSLPLPSLEAIFSVVALGTIGTAAGFFFYYKTIQLAGATYASLTVLLVPIVAFILGALILHEKLTWNLYLGLFLILIGMIGVSPVMAKKSL